jgi:xanthine dehydrogenase YagT iron-sulfur-binding subunit
LLISVVCVPAQRAFPAHSHNSNLTGEKKMKNEEDDEKKDQCQCRRGVTRRGFLASVGVGAMAALATSGRIAPAAAEASASELPGEKAVAVTLLVNDRRHRLLVEPRWSLLYVLREHLGLTGTKVGCERGECGACTVLIDDLPRYACLTLAVEAEGRRITTLEGLMQGEELGPVQQAFAEEDALQCGYCTPGQIMAVEGLLRARPQPDLDQIRQGVSGNICRCGAYSHIFKAAAKAADLKRG